MTKYITLVDHKEFNRGQAMKFFGGKVGQGQSLKDIVIIETDRSLEEVKNFPGVKTVEKDSVVEFDVAQTSIVPSPGNNPGQAIKQTNAGWALESLSRPYDDAYYYNRGGHDVDIYIIDTGVYSPHPEFGNRVQHLYSLDSYQYKTAHGHGTAVASAAAGSRCGVAKNADIYSCRVGDSGALKSAIYEAFDTIAWHHWAKTNNHPSVVNMSFGGSGYNHPELDPDEESEIYLYACHQLYIDGIVLISSSGNSNYEYENWKEAQGYLATPAAFEDVASVGSYNSDMDKSSFSNYGTNVEVWAPGTDVLVADTSDGYNLASGTSFSAPMVAGAMALVLEGSRKLANHNECATARAALLANLTLSDFNASTAPNSTDKALVTYNWPYWASFTPLFS